MAEYKGLGRGLGSLIGGGPNQPAADQQEEKQVQMVAVHKIKPNPKQPRGHFDHASLEELIESIKKHGIIQPLVVTKELGGFQLIAGERRLKSAKILEMAEVPAIVRKASEQEKLELALIENIQRKDLNPLERAHGYKQLIDEFSLTQDQVASQLGKSRAAVANTLRLLQLPDKVQKAIADGKINEGQAKILAGLPNDKEQLKLLKKIFRGKLTVRQTEKQASRSSAGKSKTKKAKAPELENKIEKLRQALGTKVDIQEEGEGGEIVISFYSSQELHELINKITRK